MEYNLLGQKIFIGSAVYDLSAYDTSIGFIETPTPWSALKYLVEVREGGIPASDTTILFDVDGFPSWGFDVIYLDSTHIQIQYRQPSYTNPDYVHVTGTATMPVRSFGSNADTGVDITNITEEDYYRYPLYIWQYTVTSPYIQVSGTRWGYGVGFADIDQRTPVSDIDTVIYSFDEDITPNRYIYNGGIMYYMFTYQGAMLYQNQFNDYVYDVDGPIITNVILRSGEEITDYTEDTNYTGGGYGSYNFFSQDIAIPGLPTLSILDTGLVTMWQPDTSQCRDLSSFLWSSSFFDNVIKLVADPLENIIQLGIVPIKPSGLSSIKGTAKEVKVGNIGTGVQMTPLTSQFIQVDMGDLEGIEEAWQTALDYEPNTKVQMFIPFVGVIDLTTYEVMNAKNINLTYNIDLFSGDFACFVTIKKTMPKNVRLNSVVYHKTGNMLVSWPLTEANYGRSYKNVLQSVIGGAMSPIGTMANVGSLVDSAISVFDTPVERGGSYTGSQSMLGCFTPYLILTQPVQHLADYYSSFEGYPSYNYFKLGDLKGFTKVEKVIDNTINATETEKKMIEKLLMEGVIL